MYCSPVWGPSAAKAVSVSPQVAVPNLDDGILAVSVIGQCTRVPHPVRSHLFRCEILSPIEIENHRIPIQSNHLPSPSVKAPLTLRTLHLLLEPSILGQDSLCPKKKVRSLPPLKSTSSEGASAKAVSQSPGREVKHVEVPRY